MTFLNNTSTQTPANNRRGSQLNISKALSHPAVIQSALMFPLACLIPPVAVLFENSMSMHMLIQMPLLIFCGVVLGDIPALQKRLQGFDPKGYTSAILASGFLIFWMLPLNLDAAQESVNFRLLKVLSLPLGLGLMASWAWQCLGGVGRGVLVLETWAMLMRVGWIFVITPEQICANYLPDEQLSVGYTLLQLGVLFAVMIVLYAFFRAEKPDKP